MSTKATQTVEFERILRELEREHENKEEAEVISFSEMRRLEPVHDFRVQITDRSVEEIMKMKAKTIEQKKVLLEMWKKAKALLARMIDGLEEDLSRAEEIQKRVDEAREKVLDQRARSGFNPFGM